MRTALGIGTSINSFGKCWRTLLATSFANRVLESNIVKTIVEIRTL